MNRCFLAWLVVLSALLSSACADEFEGRDAAYPEAIGYTPPNARRSTLAAAPAVKTAPAPPAPSGDVAEESGPEFGGDDDNAEGAPTSGANDSGASDQDGYADADPSALQDFRPALEPYGTWTDDPTYGTVWVPSADVVGDDFTPYATAGHWAFDEDYVWVSDYDWGWAPFHYGRWTYAQALGWEWIPGRRYAGAWVSWRYGAPGWDYVGWAPLAPTWCWRRGSAVGLGFVPRAPYGFVGTHDLFERSLRGHFVGGPQAATVAANTRPWVRASPSVVGGPGPRLGMRGPPPAVLNLAPSAWSASSAADRGVVQARAFARPRTAVAWGARGPMMRGGSPFPFRRPSAASGSWGGSRGAEPSPPSHFGGRFGAGFTGSPALGRPPIDSAPRVATRPDYPVRSMASRGAFEGSGGAPVFRGSYGGPLRPTAPASPSFSSAPRPSVGNYSGGAAVQPGGGFSGGGGFSHGGGFPGGGGFSHGGGFPGGGGGRGGGHR